MAEDDLGLDEDKGKKKISKTTWIYLGLAGGALVLTYLIYEHSKQPSSSGSSSGPIGGEPVNPGAEIAVPTSGTTYQPGTEMQAYQQGLQDAITLLQAQPGTGAEGSAATTPSASSGAGTSSATTPSTSSSNYPPIIDTVKGPMYVLGPGDDGPNDYHVYGGAPVYFGNADQLAQGSADQWSNGQFYAYTPVAYKNMIVGNGLPTP
jgi:hypothetical protein